MRFSEKRMYLPDYVKMVITPLVINIYFFMKLAPLDSVHIGLSIHSKNLVFMKNCKWSIFPQQVTYYYTRVRAIDYECYNIINIMRATPRKITSRKVILPHPSTDNYLLKRRHALYDRYSFILADLKHQIEAVRSLWSPLQQTREAHQNLLQ